MKNNNTIPTRVDPALKKFLDDIRVERFRSGIDRTPRSPARISLAITRVPNLKKILLEATIND